MKLRMQQGKSILEMIGVLAVVGVLSVGGLKAFSQALKQYKANQSIEDYVFFINGILQNKDLILKAHEYHIGQQLAYLGIVPGSWKIKGSTFYDRDGRKIFTYVPSASINIEYRLKESSQSSTPNDSILFCQKLWTSILLPYADVLYQVYLIVDGKSNRYWGNSICGINKPCFSSLSIQQIISECTLCLDASQCYFNFTFR